MQASVSDIVLFRKCPKAWQHAQKFSAQPSSTSALTIGSDIHKEFQHHFENTGIADDYKYLSFEMRKQIDDELLRRKLNRFAVEPAVLAELKGHNITCRPDVIFSAKSNPYAPVPRPNQVRQ